MELKPVTECHGVTRQLDEVIRAMRVHIPLNHPLLRALNGVLDAIGSCPADYMWIHWHRVTPLLKYHLKPPLTEEWQIEVLHIWTTRDKTELWGQLG